MTLVRVASYHRDSCRLRDVITRHSVPMQICKGVVLVASFFTSNYRSCSPATVDVYQTSLGPKNLGESPTGCHSIFYGNFRKGKMRASACKTPSQSVPGIVYLDVVRPARQRVQAG